MISRLFKGKKRLDSEDPAERVAAIEALGEQELDDSQERLTELVNTDPSPDVRRVALARITDVQYLEALLSGVDSREMACSHIAGLLNAGRISGFENHPDVIVSRLAANPTAELIDSVLNLGDVETLLAATLAVPREQRDVLLDNRQYHLTSVLQELEHRSRDHDKRLNRFARDRLEEIRKQRAEAERLTNRIAERLEALEKPIAHETSQEVRRRQTLLLALDEDLGDLEQAAGVMERAGESIADATSLRSRRQRLSEPVLEDEPPDAAESEASIDTSSFDTNQFDASPFDALTSSFVELEQALTTEIDFGTLAHQRQALTDDWLAIADQRPPDAAQHKVFERVSHRFQQLTEAHTRLTGSDIQVVDLSGLADPAGDPAANQSEHSLQAFESLGRQIDRTQKAIRRIAWPDWAATPESLLVVMTSVDAANDRLEPWKAQLAVTEANVKKLLQTLAEQASAGELTSAKQEANRIRNQLAILPRNRTQQLSRELARISAQLTELSDWQTFATTPKREALLDAMHALAEQPLAPKDQASRIKHLRSEWNELGRASRSLDHRLADRFNDAAEKAFEPCREYFSEQATQRAENLAAREAICGTLVNYLQQTDWHQTDYKAAEQILRTARTEWRQFHPVDRTPGKPLEAQFEKLQDQLHGHIKAEWDRNLIRKGQIVEQAQALIDADDDVRDKVERAKNLQQQWKEVGVTPRRPDQALWRDFRNACDQIFAAREDARRSADLSIQAAQEEVQALLDEFRGVLDAASGINDATLRDLQNRYQELPGLPDRMQRPADRDFSELMKSGRMTLKAEKQAAEKRYLEDLRRLDVDLSVLEQRHIDGEDVSFESTDPLFDTRWQHIDDPVPIEDLQRLTIEAEIAAGLDSPQTDRERRLEIQVELMNTGRGREVLDVDGAELLKTWCTMGPKGSQADGLRGRFFGAIDKLANR